MQLLPVRLGRKLDIKPDTILVYVGEGLIGDAFLRLPFAAALRNAFPDAVITWAFRTKGSVAGRRIAPLLGQFCDEFIFDLAVGDGLGEVLNPRPLQAQSWDLVIDTQRVVPRAALVSRIPHRRFVSVAGRYVLSDVKPLYRLGRPVTVRHHGRQLLSLLGLIETGSLDDSPPFVPAPIRVPDEATAWAAGLMRNQVRPIMIAPGAGGRQKCWPLEQVAELARSLTDADQAVAILLGPEEGEWRTQLGTAAPRAMFSLDAMPPEIARTEPYATMALAQHAAVTVAMDSGIGHMLASTSPRHVTLYGPTRAGGYDPAARDLRIVKSQDFGGNEMRQIPVAAVRDAILNAVASGRELASAA